MVLLVALCHRSMIISQRPRTCHATMLASMTRRPFFSFLFCNDGNSSRLTDAETATKVKLQQEATRILLDGVYHRVSTQHAHPLGPWQAILTVVQDHYNSWVEVQDAMKKKEDNVISTMLPATSTAVAPFRVLDLACGPLGQPGTTIAHALPLAAVLCTDSCSVAVAAIPLHIYADETSNNNTAADIGIGIDIGGLNEKKSILSAIAEDDDATTQVLPVVTTSYDCPILPPPKNLTKSITDLTDLSSYDSNSFDAIICCYGYTLSSNIQLALSEAYRVLVPGGVLVIATWERSAMIAIGRDVVASVRGGGRDPYTALDDDEAFLPPRIVPVNKMELSGVGELEGLLVASGFDQPQAVATSSVLYPIDLGSTPADQFAMGTILARDELESLGALGPLATCGGGNGAGGWGNLAEEAFWMNIQKYADVVEGNMLLRDNAFKLTVSTKK